MGDVHATPAYRRHLARVMTMRALERAFVGAMRSVARAASGAAV
jgi:CO/xanthine dehydrogenase FAD-binding subunit